MHSRIFHITDSKESVVRFRRTISSYIIEELDVEYITDQNDWGDDLEWFKDNLPEGMFNIEIIGHELAELTYIGYPKKYLNDKVEYVRELVSRLDENTLLDGSFRNEIEAFFYEYGGFIIDEGGKYVRDVHFNNWLLWIAKNNKIGDKFYLGTILDYHY